NCPERTPAARLTPPRRGPRRGPVRDQPLAQLARPLPLSDLREGGDEPEGADRERPLRAAEPVVGLVDLIAEDQPVLGALVRDREDRRLEPLVLAAQEADQRDEEE